MNPPTKRELLLIKQNLLNAKKTWKLLDLQYKALFVALRRMEKQQAALQARLSEEVPTAERLLAAAKTEVNPVIISCILQSIPYPLREATAAADEAYFAYVSVNALRAELSELEEKIKNLRKKTKKIKKRINALEYLLIPRYEERIKFIGDYLEEKERGELILKIAAIDVDRP